MLSRTANNLFWMARYVERAEFVARLLEVALQMSGMKSREGRTEWNSALIASGCEAGYFAKYDEVTARNVVDYLARDPDNPSSIYSCLSTARQNARSVRTALTVDSWEAINGTWLDIQVAGRQRFAIENLDNMLSWVKRRALQFNGAYNNTMLRGDAFYFCRLGTYLERADNTARILDVKYHVLLPEYEQVGGLLDYYHWRAILRAVSALRAYHRFYRDRISPWNVAELLILQPQLPRSLRGCYDQVTGNLDLLAGQYGGQTGECHRLAGEFHARLRYGRIQDVFDSGLHEFLTETIDRSIVLGKEIQRFYLM